MAQCLVLPKFQMDYSNHLHESESDKIKSNFGNSSRSEKKHRKLIPRELESSNQETNTVSVEELQMIVNKGKENNRELKAQIRKKMFSS